MKRYPRHWRAATGTSLLLLTCSLFSLVSAGQYTSPYVILQGTLATSSGNPAPNATLTLVPSQVCFVPGQSVVVQESQCSSDINGNVVGTGNPVSGPQVNVQYVGTLPTGNYYVVFTWYDQFGIQSLKSPEVAAQLTHAGELQILPPAGNGPPNAVGMAVYIGTAPGGETFQGTTLNTTAQFTQAVPLGYPIQYITITSGGVFPSCPTLYTFTPSDAGNGASAVPVCASIGGGNVQLVGFQSIVGGQSYTVPPAVSTNGTPSVAPVLSAVLNTAQTPPIRNLTACRVVANDACFPTGTGYTASLVDASGNNLFNYSEMWQFFGPGSTYNLSQGIPYYHGQVTYPIPILTIPFNHNPQAISGPLSLSGYNLYNVGAVGVGTATPAWGVDVEGAGLDALINATGGYVINGNGGSVGQCLASDGTAYDTPVNCLTSIGSIYYQTVDLAGTAQTQRPALNFGTYFTATDSASPARTTIGLNTVGTDTNLLTASASGSSGHCAQWDSLGGIGDSGAACARAVAQKNCLSVSCSGGSTYASGTTYTNSSGGAVLEEVTLTSALSGGGTGGDATISATINSLAGPANGVYNQCDGVASVTFIVPPGGTFSATAARVDGCSGGSVTITSWLESTL